MYYLDSTGVAFDPENARLLLIGDGTQKIYPYAQIRSVQPYTEGATEWYLSSISGPLLQRGAFAISTWLKNRIELKKAYEKSGLFVKVTDLDHPVWQIKFSEERMRNKYDEIFAQSREGTRPPERKTS